MSLGMQRPSVFRVVVLSDAIFEIARLPNIDFIAGIDENVDPKAGWGVLRFGSSARTRTWNPSVNSRMLYH